MPKATICFDYEGDELRVGIAASCVVFAAFGGVVGDGRGVGGGSVFSHGVGDAYVDVVGGGVVCGA